mgnify:CR=1 FL=1
MKVKILIFVILFTSFFSFSQQQKSNIDFSQKKTLWQEFTYDLGNMAEGMGYAYTRPLYWKKNNGVILDM